MITKVQVEVTCRKYVVIEVIHAEDDDPCDLTPIERAEAIEAADLGWHSVGDVQIENVHEVPQ